MAKMINDYQIIRCPHCCSEYYDSNAIDGDDVGDPKTRCPACGKISYRTSILEPAIIGGNKFFEVKFSSLYKKLLITISVFFAILVVLCFVMRNVYVSTGLLATGMIMYVFYEIIKITHRKNYLKSEEYERAVRQSLERLKDEEYAHIIIVAQGIDVESIYYAEMAGEEEAQ